MSNMKHTGCILLTHIFFIPHSCSMRKCRPILFVIVEHSGFDRYNPICVICHSQLLSDLQSYLSLCFECAGIGAPLTFASCILRQFEILLSDLFKFGVDVQRLFWEGWIHDLFRSSVLCRSCVQKSSTVCQMGDLLMEELPEDFESLWPDFCKMIDNKWRQCSFVNLPH